LAVGLAVEAAVGVGEKRGFLANSFGAADGVAVISGPKVGVGKGVKVGQGVTIRGEGEGTRVTLFASWVCFQRKTAVGMITKRTNKKPIIQICLWDKGLNSCNLGAGWGGGLS